jgi:predicted Zn finger-like uncharacterized protein
VLTQCPNCQTTFRITSEILRVAHGQVRCGRCQTQFDALERLIEEESPAESGFEATPQQRAQIEVEEPEAQEDITLEGRHIEITGTYRVMDDAQDEPQVRQEFTEEWVEIDDADADDGALANEGIEVEEDFADREIEAAATDYEADAPEHRTEHDRFSRRLAVASAQHRATEESARDLELIAPRRSRTTAMVWKALAVPLVLLLLLQVVHHYRSALVRQPRIGPLLSSAYTAAGAALTPDWHLHEYEIKQWGVLSDPVHPGTLKVRASITNRAAFPQPFPLLKLVLEDRWGDQVRVREFEPAEYADPGTPTDRLLTPGQGANATIAIVDPGPDAEGFRFDVCLRGKAPVPVCAAEVPQ